MGAAGPLNLGRFHSERFNPGDPTRHPSGCPSREPNPGGSIRTTIRTTIRAIHLGAAQLRGPIPGHSTSGGSFGPPILGAQTEGHPGDLPGCPTPSGSTRPPLPGHPSWCGSTSGAKPRAVQPGHPFRAAIAGPPNRPPLPGPQTQAVQPGPPDHLYRRPIVSRTPPPA